MRLLPGTTSRQWITSRKRCSGSLATLRRTPIRAGCEFYAKRYTSSAAHFRRAIEFNPQGQAVADNMALAIRVAGARRARIAEKPLAELNELYRTALSGQKLAPLARDSPPALVLNGLGGRAVTTQRTMVRLLKKAKHPGRQ